MAASSKETQWMLDCCLSSACRWFGTEGVDCSRLGGFLNVVVRAAPPGERQAESVIVKCTPPFLASKHDVPLSRTRHRHEMASLDLLASMPGAVSGTPQSPVAPFPDVSNVVVARRLQTSAVTEGCPWPSPPPASNQPEGSDPDSDGVLVSVFSDLGCTSKPIDEVLVAGGSRAFATAAGSSLGSFFGRLHQSRYVMAHVAHNRAAFTNQPVQDLRCQLQFESAAQHLAACLGQRWPLVERLAAGAPGTSPDESPLLLAHAVSAAGRELAALLVAMEPERRDQLVAGAVGLARRVGAGLRCWRSNRLTMGDLWLQSILVRRLVPADQDPARAEDGWGLGIIDWEFSHAGHTEQDLGHLAAHTLMLAHAGDQRRRDLSSGEPAGCSVNEAATALWEAFRESYGAANVPEGSDSDVGDGDGDGVTGPAVLPDAVAPRSHLAQAWRGEVPAAEAAAAGSTSWVAAAVTATEVLVRTSGQFGGTGYEAASSPAAGDDRRLLAVEASLAAFAMLIAASEAVSGSEQARDREGCACIDVGMRLLRACGLAVAS